MNRAKELLMQGPDVSDLATKYGFTQISTDVWTRYFETNYQEPVMLDLVLSTVNRTVNLEVRIAEGAIKHKQRHWTLVRSDISIDTADRVINALLHHSFWDTYELLDFLEKFDFR